MAGQMEISCGSCQLTVRQPTRNTRSCIALQCDDGRTDGCADQLRVCLMNERRSLGAGHVRGAHTVVSLTSDIPSSTPYAPRHGRSMFGREQD